MFVYFHFWAICDEDIFVSVIVAELMQDTDGAFNCNVVLEIHSVWIIGPQHLP